MTELIKLLESSILEQTFITCIFSNPRKKDGFEKIVAKPTLLNGIYHIQFEKFKNQKAYHENIEIQSIRGTLEDLIPSFKQIQCYTTAHDYQILMNKKGHAFIKQQPPTKKLPDTLSHNRQKKYLLDHPSSQSFLKALGLMDASGQIKPSKYDKYKQINRYLEIVSESLKDYHQKTIRIVDFGCGKSYLTFALYHYLTVCCHKEVEVIGLDLKEDVIHLCHTLAEKLHYEHLKFQVGDIGAYTTDQAIDMVISLHACNTATDAALYKAISWQAKIILAVPCCHHEAYPQIKQTTLQPILKHGILKERIAALVTDGLRAQLLEAVGYKVQVIEFIDSAHTPKNILIRAVSNGPLKPNHAAYKDYQEAAKMLHLDLSLERYLKHSL